MPHSPHYDDMYDRIEQEQEALGYTCPKCGWSPDEDSLVRPTVQVRNHRGCQPPKEES